MARPRGEISQALVQAAADLFTPERAATSRELAAKAMVGVAAANSSIRDLRRSGRLLPVRLRQVAHRTRPVAEYAPTFMALAYPAAGDAEAPASGWADLSAAISRCWR